MQSTIIFLQKSDFLIKIFVIFAQEQKVLTQGLVIVKNLKPGHLILHEHFPFAFGKLLFLPRRMFMPMPKLFDF